MLCPKCGTDIKDTHKFCPKCGYAVTEKDNESKTDNHIESKAKTKKDKKKRRTKIIACICAISILISGTIGGLIFYLSLSANDSDSKYVCLDAGFTDVIIKSEDDAIKAAQSVAGILGITDAEKELKISNVNKVDGDTYYRMQQYYNDIPVYGRSVVVAADALGCALSLTANTEPITINYDYAKYINGDSETVIYVYGSKQFVCNVNYVQQDGENLKTFSDVKSGKLIASLSMDYTALENEYISENNGVFTVFDESRNLKVLNSNKKELLKTYDFNGRKVKRSFYTKGNENKIRDVENDKFLGYEAEFIINNDISFVSSDNKAKLDKNAIQLINSTEIAYDYYKEMFGRSGFDNMNSRMYISYNDKNDNGNNAYAHAGSLLSFGYNIDISQIDVVAHEYTHSVELTISNMTYEGESGAIMEAYSDIFGELIQAKAAQSEPDWIMYPAMVNRNMCDPYKSREPLPDTYKGKYWQTTENKKDKNGKSTNDCGHVHGNSTVISHAAYLMWNGIDGNESMKIDSDTLAKLWYRALFLLQSDATFSQCRNAVELSARIMVKNKQLTAEQYESVTKAFDAVGIDTAPYTYAKTVKNDFDLSVLSHEETENVNFNLTIYKMPVIKAGPNIKNTGMPKKVMEKTSLSGKQHLHLEDGTYILELRDIADDQNQTQTITAKIVVNGKNKKAVDEVKIYTDFTDIITVVLNDEESMYYRYIQENLEVLDLDLFPDSGGNNKGVFSALIRDFDNDGNKELITFSITYNAASQEYLVMHLYKIIQGAVTLCDTSDEMFASGAGNFQNDFCGTLEENCIKLQYSVGSYGYSSFGEQYRTYAIAENQFVLKEDFKLYEAYRYDDYKYEEMVSGKQYSSNEDFIKAVETAGFDVSLHHHVSYENSGFNPETDDYKTYEGFRGNHIFALYNSRDMNGDYGFIYDNTNLRQYIDVSNSSTNKNEQENHNLNLKATESDFSQLEKLLENVGMIEEYNSNDSNAYINVMRMMLMFFGNSSCYYYFYEDMPEQFYNSDETDPLRSFTDRYAYARLPANKVDWVVKNIFNVTPQRSSTSIDLGGYKFYYYEDYYYWSYGDAGFLGYDAKIKNISSDSENSYTIVVDFYCGESFDCSYKIYCNLKNINRKRQWTFTGFEKLQ